MTNPVINLQQDGHYVIRADMRNVRDMIFVPHTNELELEELQNLVGGYIELLTIADGGMEVVGGGPFGRYLQPRGAVAHMFFNEEGKLQGLDINPLATAIAHVMGGLPDIDCIVGDTVIVCGQAKEKPDEAS